MLQFGDSQTLSYKILPPLHHKAGGCLLSFLQEATAHHCLWHLAKVGWVFTHTLQADLKSDHAPLLHQFMLAIAINKVMVLSNAWQSFHSFL